MTILVTDSRRLVNFCYLGYGLNLFELKNKVNETSLKRHQKMVNFNYTCYINKENDGCLSLECFSSSLRNTDGSVR